MTNYVVMQDRHSALDLVDGCHYCSSDDYYIDLHHSGFIQYNSYINFSFNVDFYLQNNASFIIAAIKNTSSKMFFLFTELKIFFFSNIYQS